MYALLARATGEAGSTATVYNGARDEPLTKGEAVNGARLERVLSRREILRAQGPLHGRCVDEPAGAPVHNVFDKDVQIDWRRLW